MSSLRRTGSEWKRPFEIGNLEPGKINVWTIYLSNQCSSKGNISGEARERRRHASAGGTRAPEARGTRVVWGHAPPENFEI